MMEFIARLHLSPLATDALRLLVWFVILVIIFLPLEHWFPVQRQKVFRRAWRNDVLYFFLNGLLPKLVIALAMSVIALHIHQLFPSAFYDAVARVPFGLRVVLAMIVGDTGAYWGHRLMHEREFLWRFHAIHHSAEQLDWLVSTRAHPVDMIWTRLWGLIPMYALGLAQPMSNQLDTAPLLMSLVVTVWGFFIHANLRWRFGFLEYFISTPHFHHWHHTNDNVQVINKNYAAMLPWLDKVFGTFYLPKQTWPVQYGIDATLSNNILVQLLHAFYFWKK